jgi:hypothetical protein
MTGTLAARRGRPDAPRERHIIAGALARTPNELGQWLYSHQG